MGHNLKNRLARVEQQLAKIEEKKTPAICNCHAIVVVGTGREEQFKTELNRTCPAHGFRELFIIHCCFVEPGDLNRMPRTIENPEVDELLNEYHRRLAQANRAA